MPELPEIQAHAERLQDDFGGAILTSFRALSISGLKTALPDPADATGHPLDHVGRRGKYLLMAVGPVGFIVHLMQGGRLKPEPVKAKPPSPRPRGGLARWSFADGRTLLLTEAGTEHRAGVWTAPADAILHAPVLGHLGPEADQVSAEEVEKLLAAHPMRLHSWLRDQTILAGLGRRLANELCWTARLSPFAATAKLGRTGAVALVQAIAVAVAESLAYERTRNDMSASADRPGAVHHRQGQPCPRCDDTVRAVEYRSYTVNYCPTCQTAGKVLADNTTSRFLK